MGDIMSMSFLFILCLAGFFAITLYALYRNRDIKALLKLPFAVFSFETKGKNTVNKRES